MTKYKFEIGKEIYNHFLGRWCKPTSVKDGKVRVKYTYHQKGKDKTFYSIYTVQEFEKMLK